MIRRPFPRRRVIIEDGRHRPHQVWIKDTVACKSAGIDDNNTHDFDNDNVDAADCRNARPFILSKANIYDLELER